MNKSEHIWNSPLKNSELKVYQYGHEECMPEHSFGPATRDHYLLHFITKGKGTFFCGNKSYTLSAGEGFLICPGVVTSYHADKNDPWTYSWIGFNGMNAEYYLKQIGLSTQSPLFVFQNTNEFTEVFDAFKTLNLTTFVGQVRVIAYFYMLLALIIENATLLSSQGKAFFNSKDEYVKNAVSYIQTNFSRKLTVNELAEYVGLNRSYFGVIFKELTHMSPQDFIIDFKVNKAKNLLSDVSMSIGDVARSVGYDDPLTFSKIFKKIVGISPNAYRKSR